VEKYFLRGIPLYGLDTAIVAAKSPSVMVAARGTPIALQATLICFVSDW
jgi:hypothetical protein